MREGAQHCPFLNRSDPACAQHLHLESLQYAFDHCLGQYDACCVYGDLLARRPVAGQPQTMVHVSVRGHYPKRGDVARAGGLRAVAA